MYPVPTYAELRILVTTDRLKDRFEIGPIADAAFPPCMDPAYYVRIEPAAGHQQKNPIVGLSRIQSHQGPVDDRPAHGFSGASQPEIAGQKVLIAGRKERDRQSGRRAIDQLGRRSISANTDQRPQLPLGMVLPGRFCDPVQIGLQFGVKALLLKQFGQSLGIRPGRLAPRLRIHRDQHPIAILGKRLIHSCVRTVCSHVSSKCDRVFYVPSALPSIGLSHCIG